MIIFRHILSVIIIATLAACGGGGSGGGAGGGGGVAATTPSAPTPSVTLKLSTTGTPSLNMSGIDITITLPTGITPSLNADGSVGATVVAVSGVAAPGTVITPVYVAASGLTKGTLRFAMASNALTGFGAGEFATVVLNRSGGVSPVLGDFILSGFTPISLLGSVIPAGNGLTETVSSINII
jgi:hypothetical protein